MSNHAADLPDDPAELKAMIAALQAENAKMAVTLRVHDQLVQALRLRIAKLQKLAFGKSSEKIEREILERPKLRYQVEAITERIEAKLGGRVAHS